MGNFLAKSNAIVYVSYSRGIFEFSYSGQWTVQMLIEAVKTEHNTAEVPNDNVPRPPSDWMYQSMLQSLDYGFVREFRGYDMSEYREDELLANNAVLEAGCKVYLVSREKK